MSDKKMRKHLKSHTRAQLVALGRQKSEVPYQELLGMTKDALVEVLVQIKGVLKPEAA